MSHIAAKKHGTLSDGAVGSGTVSRPGGAKYFLPLLLECLPSCMMRRLVVSSIFSAVLVGFQTVVVLAQPTASAAAASDEQRLVGIKLSREPLDVRVVDNTSRLCPLRDEVMPGYNGLSLLVCSEQGRNIFNPAGMNYETCTTSPKMGLKKDVWNAPRVAPLTIEQLGPDTVRLAQKGSEAAGLNMEITFTVSASGVDQVITTWPDVDIESSHTFWASYMNLVQNTSLYLRAALKGESETRWLEMTSAGHNSKGSGTFFRLCDPSGKAWHDFLTDNPVQRQAINETPESVAATERAGFRMGEVASFDHFFFGFVDDYVALWIFRKPQNGKFHPWISASGYDAVRRPAWDYGILSGSQKAGERRDFHVRLVYKRFAGIDDVMEEVERFQAGG